MNGFAIVGLRLLLNMVGRVCSNHFLSSDYNNSVQLILLNEAPRKGRLLKPDALPTLHIDDIDKQNMPSMSIEVISQIQGTPSNIKCESPEFNETPINKAAGPSKVVDESNENIMIPLAKYKLLKKTFKEFHDLKKNMKKIFTPGQIRRLTKPHRRRVTWSAEDIAAAISLRSISSKGYRYLRATVGIPLPAISTLHKWASKYRIKEIQS